VQRYVLHVGAVVEDLLRAVAVVVVDVDHGDLHACRRGDVMGDDRGVVEEAVAAVVRRRRMMAGRPAQPVRGALAAEHQRRGGQRGVDRAAGGGEVVSVNGVVVSKQYQPRRPLIDVGTRAGVIPRRIAGR